MPIGVTNLINEDVSRPLMQVETQSPVIQERDRTKIADKYKWDLSHIYPNEEAWKQAKEKLISQLPGIEKHKG